jgi:Family of unknown function (DUF5947)
MKAMQPSMSDNPLAVLRRFARVRERSPAELCDLCSAGLSDAHQHLIELEQRRVVCVCDACAILFGNQGETRYRRVPRHTRFLLDFRLTDAQWQSLMIPIQLAFIFHNSVAKRMVALYPSPAGPTESWLEAAAWAEIVALNPVLQKMEPDVEALLINRIGGMGRVDSDGNGAHEYYIAPIDECFRLTGLLRAHWRGLSGGIKVWEEIAHFFLELKKRATVNEEEPCA